MYGIFSSKTGIEVHPLNPAGIFQPYRELIQEELDKKESRKEIQYKLIETLE